MTQPQASIARPRAPGWLSCELCERPASRPHRRLRLTLVRHNEEQHPHDRADDTTDPRHYGEGRRDAVPPPDAVQRQDAVSPAMLVLLCSDCCALIVGIIDDEEWRSRIDNSPGHGNLAMLPPLPS